MDPITNLHDQLVLARKIIADDERDELVKASDAIDLAELVIALDHWRRRGGFDPYTTKENQ